MDAGVDENDGALRDDRMAASDEDGRMETTVVLDNSGHSIAAGRHFAIAFLDQARLHRRTAVSTKTVELAQLVVSELVTNAHKYAPGPVQLRLRLIAASLEISVWDSQPDLPAARSADPARIGQHGLEIVTAIAESVEIRREVAGKRITVRLALHDSSLSHPGPHPA